MEINKQIGKKLPVNTLIKSLFWNSIKEVFSENEKDISSYLNAIDIKGATIFVKTQNPLINNEIRMRESTLREIFQKKLQKTGVQFNEYTIKYL